MEPLLRRLFAGYQIEFGMAGYIIMRFLFIKKSFFRNLPVFDAEKGDFR